MYNYGESLQGPQGLGGGELFEQLAKRMPKKSPMGGAWDAIQPTQPPTQLGGGVEGLLGGSLPERAPLTGASPAGLGGLAGQLGGAVSAMGSEPLNLGGARAPASPSSPAPALHMPGWNVGRRPPMTTQFGYGGGGLMSNMMGRLPSNDQAGY